MTKATDRETRSRAGKVGARASLVELRLKKVDAELLSPVHEGPFELNVQVRPTFDVAGPLVAYTVEYELRATAADDQPVLRAVLVFLLLYELPDDPGVDDEDLTAFGRVSVLFSLHPYVRETVQTLTSRFGLPPLLLDVLRSPLDESAASGGSEVETRT